MSCGGLLQSQSNLWFECAWVCVCVREKKQTKKNTIKGNTVSECTQSFFACDLCFRHEWACWKLNELIHKLWRCLALPGINVARKMRGAWENDFQKRNKLTFKCDTLMSSLSRSKISSISTSIASVFRRWWWNREKRKEKWMKWRVENI